MRRCFQLSSAANRIRNSRLLFAGCMHLQGRHADLCGNVWIFYLLFLVFMAAGLIRLAFVGEEDVPIGAAMSPSRRRICRYERRCLHCSSVGSRTHDFLFFSCRISELHRRRRPANRSGNFCTSYLLLLGIMSSDQSSLLCDVFHFVSIAWTR